MRRTLRPGEWSGAGRGQLGASHTIQSRGRLASNKCRRRAVGPTQNGRSQDAFHVQFLGLNKAVGEGLGRMCRSKRGAGAEKAHWNEIRLRQVLREVATWQRRGGVLCPGRPRCGAWRGLGCPVAAQEGECCGNWARKERRGGSARWGVGEMQNMGWTVSEGPSPSACWCSGVSQAKRQASRQPRAEAEHRTELGVPGTCNSVTWARAHDWPGNRQHGAVLAGGTAAALGQGRGVCAPRPARNRQWRRRSGPRPPGA